MYAALGFEPNPALAAAPRWLCGTPTLRAPPAVPWRIKASDVIGALGACGVVVDVDALGESLGKESRGGAGAGVGEPSSRTAAKRKRPAAATTGGEGDGLCALSGRGEGDREATVQLYQDERRSAPTADFRRDSNRRGGGGGGSMDPASPLRLRDGDPGQGLRTPASAANAVREEGPHCWVRDDPEGAADLLAVLAGLRIDPRAGALRAAVDHCAENILAAAALGCDGDEWRAFRSAAASKLARVGPTHAARLAAIRWIPWSTRKEQEVQDLAALVAIEHIVPLILQRLEADDAATTTTARTPLRRRSPGQIPRRRSPPRRATTSTRGRGGRFKRWIPFAWTSSPTWTPRGRFTRRCTSRTSSCTRAPWAAAPVCGAGAWAQRRAENPGEGSRGERFAGRGGGVVHAVSEADQG